MTRKLLYLFCCLSACAPLSPHESLWGSAAEVVGRTIAAPLTLGASELLFSVEESSQRERRAYVRWYRRLSPEQQAQEDQREAVRRQALGFALSGGGPFRAPQISAGVPLITPFFLPRFGMTCLSLPAGTLTTMDCY